MTFDRKEADRLISLVSPRHRHGGSLGLTIHGELADHLHAALTEIDRLTTELDHVAPASDRDHLSRASRRMVDTVMGDREALRAKVRELDVKVAELTGERDRPPAGDLPFRFAVATVADNYENSVQLDTSSETHWITADEADALAGKLREQAAVARSVERVGESTVMQHDVADPEVPEPEWEYATTTGPRKGWDPTPPSGDGWEPDKSDGRDGWERFDDHEEAYWKRRKP